MSEHRERLRKAIDDMERTEVCLEIFDRAIAQLEVEVRASRQQETAWRLAFEGLERQHKALTDQIPADMIQADPILVERVTVAAAMEEIGRQQIADLQAEVARLREELNDL